MKYRCVVLSGLLIAPLLLAASLQERVKPKEAEDVPALLQQAGKAWEAKQLGKCLKSLRQAQQVVLHERAKAVRAALPAAPKGFEKVAVEEDADPAAHALAAAMSVGVGSMIEQEYRATDGGATLRVTITADSPFMQMFSMWIANPSLLEPGSEVVKYGPHNAVLKKQGGGWQLMVLIGQDLCDISLDGRDDDFLLSVFDQAAVDRIAAVLAN